MIVIVILLAVPPDGILGGLVYDEELILRRATGVDACHYVDSAQLAHLSLLVTLERRISLILEETVI